MISRLSAIQIRRRHEAFALGLKLAKEVDADLVLATDPDADRLGVYVKDSKDRRISYTDRKYVRLSAGRL